MDEIGGPAEIPGAVVVGGIVEGGELSTERDVQLVGERRLRLAAHDVRREGERARSFGCLEQSDGVAVRQRTDLRNQDPSRTEMRRKSCLPTDFVGIATVVAGGPWHGASNGRGG